jgi:hypothetical protein
MRTVARPIEGTEVRVEPTESPGIEVNGVPASLDAVGKADVRVDLVSDAGRGRSFVVEHVLAPLGLHGITGASVVGIRDDWAFARPEHRFCYAAGLGPDAVVGHPEGLPNPALASALDDVGIVESEPQSRQTVSEPVTFASNGGEIELRPRDYGGGIRFEARYGDAEITAEVDPRGGNDPELIDSVVSATTPYLTPEDGEAVTHSIADLVADVAVVGGFDDLFVEVDLGEAYHALTIGAAREARRQGVVERR